MEQRIVVRRSTHFLLRQMIMTVNRESRENERLEIQKRGKYEKEASYVIYQPKMNEYFIL